MKTGRLAVIDGVRTPFCKAGTELAAMGADELGRQVVNALLSRTGIALELIDEVIFGCVSQPAEAMNAARVVALRAGIPESVPAVTVHRNCASGVEAITTAHQRLASGQGEVFIVGGTESMSQAPLLYQLDAASKFQRVSRARTPFAKLAAVAQFRPTDFVPRIGIQLGLTDPVSGLNMGETAEVLARENAISREAQDMFACRSHRLAARSSEIIQVSEIAPVYHNGKAVRGDNGIRANQSMEALAKLKPIFDRKTGSVTAGNASQITDGAVALLVMSEARAHTLNLQPLGYLGIYAYTGCDPKRMGLGPVSAIKRTCRDRGVTLADADIVEINEAFAAQVLAVRQHLRDAGLGDLSESQLNPNGGAIAIGHPVGATGARLVLTSLRELQRREESRALVSLCVGGGQGAALWLERN